jgi:hypothetical protein
MRALFGQRGLRIETKAGARERHIRSRFLGGPMKNLFSYDLTNSICEWQCFLRFVKYFDKANNCLSQELAKIDNSSKEEPVNPFNNCNNLCTILHILIPSDPASGSIKAL